MARSPIAPPPSAAPLPAARATLAGILADPFFAEHLFDRLADVVFFVKDAAGRYVIVNNTLTRRCGCRHKHEVLGRSPLDLFPPDLGAAYAAQDRAVLSRGQAIEDRLELHLYPSRAPGWCLTHKIPLRDAAGRIVGLAGISRDLRGPDPGHPAYAHVAAVIAHLQAHYDEPLALPALARRAGMSVTQLERYIARIFDLTPKQLIIKTRLDAAARLLAGEGTVAEIAHACGYADHSAFARQFKAAAGLTPTAYRALVGASPIQAPKADVYVKDKDRG